jgi:hypothetical protein
MQYELRSLDEELRRQRANSKDLVVDTRNLFAQGQREGLKLVVQGLPQRHVFEPPVTIPPGGSIELAIQGEYPPRPEAFGVTEWAHAQLGEKCGIPMPYYRKMMDAGRYDLLAENINAWIIEKEKRLLRILDGKVRAILSDRYRRMDNYDLLYAALDRFEKHGVEVHRCDLTERHMYVKVVKLHEMREIKENDRVVPGVILSNSEVGEGGLKIEPFMLRLVCMNGMIGESVIRRIHLGDRLGEGEYFSEETQRLEDEALWAKVRDIIDATFDPVIFQEWVDRVKQGTEVKVPSPTRAVNNVAARYNISEDRKNNLLDYFTTQEDTTQWGLANAVTRLAQEYEHPEDQVDLEKAGYELSTMGAEDFIGMVDEEIKPKRTVKRWAPTWDEQERER